MTGNVNKDSGLSFSTIHPLTDKDHSAITAVWEASVRATHDFLAEEDILFYKPKIAEYAKVMDSFSVKDPDGRIVGFIGVADRNIEMLFIHPSQRGKGGGKRLLNFAFEKLNACKVDVNEQNEQALFFYRKMGFEVVGRDELDSSGKPYPILHMQLKMNTD